jgi:hypothetical protein
MLKRHERHGEVGVFAGHGGRDARARLGHGFLERLVARHG